MTRGNATSAMARPDRPHAEPIPGQTSALLGRHPHGAIGTAVCRRGHLPFGCLEDVAALAAETGQPFSRYEAAAGSILYLPELLGQPVGSDRSDHPAPQARGYDRHYFESIFSRSRDPWVYRSPYEQLKYQQTLDLIPATAGRGLELACAEGDFTEMFAGRVGQLVAGDISQLALDRAKRRCDGLSNVEFRRLDLMVDPLPSGLDAIVCSEVLYFVGLDRLPTVAAKLAAALALGGVLVLAHANMTVDAPDQPGFDWGLLYGALTIGRTFAADPDLRFVKELQSRHYRIQLFRKDTRSSGEAPRGHEPESIEAIPSAEPIATVAATFRPASAAASRAEAPIETWRLPILMYHRVAPAGSPRTRRYRVSPGDFDRQMGYLADSGFYTVSTDQWREAIHYRTPLPGRAMIITFDDGYRDFAEHAWPVLRRHGLGATMFIVSDRVGTANAWDWMYRDEVPLLDWAEIRDLASQGVEFGSHSATHRSLTAAPPEEAARELLRSRLILSRELGRPVSAVAYPYGDADPVVQQMAGHVGYLYGFTCRWGRARHDDPLLGLPRIEVDGTGSFADFVAKLA